MAYRLTHHEIYDAALDEEAFTALPECLAREMDVPSAMFFWIHPGEFQEITAGTQPETDVYYTEFVDNDPWMAQASDDLVGIGAFRLTQFVSAESFEKSAMYNEFIRPNRLDRFWCLGALQDTRDGRVVTAFHKGRGQEDFSDAQLGVFNHHAGDLGRLHAIRRELSRNRVHEIASADHSLRDDLPIFELDHEGRLMRLNGPAEALLVAHPLLILQRNRGLVLGGPQARAFRRAVGAATREGHARAGSLDLARCRAQDGRLLPELRLNLLPQSSGGRRVLVIVTTEHPQGVRAAFEQPREHLHLTRRERDVLQGFIRGLRRDQLAHELGVTVATVDLHSGNLRRKLGARSIPEAIARALREGIY